MKTYVGVADCHGLESFYEKDKIEARQIVGFKMRADTNRQRHAVFYETELDNATKDAVLELCKKDLNARALSLMKRKAKSFKVPKEHASSVELIPNAKLDPYGGG